MCRFHSAVKVKVMFSYGGRKPANKSIAVAGHSILLREGKGLLLGFLCLRVPFICTTESSGEVFLRLYYNRLCVCMRAC